MRKFVYDKVDITIPIGGTNVNVYETLREGICVGVKVVPFENLMTSPYPSHAINLGVEDSQSNELISAVDVRDYINQGAGYLEGYKPVNLPLRGRVNVIAQSAQPISGSPISFQVIFAIDISNCEG